MYFRKAGIATLCLATVMGLAGCVGTSTNANNVNNANAPVDTQTDLKAAYAKLAQSGGKTFVLDPQRSEVRIYAFRGGSAGKFGHNHVLSAPQFQGYFYLPPGGAEGGRFDLAFRLDQLEIDNPAHRLTLGPAFTSTPSPEAIASTREHMLGQSNLDANHFPFVRLRALQISGEAPKFAARIELEMHGQRREMWVPLNVYGLPDQLTVSGAFVLRQTDFGIKPYSFLNGLVSVLDAVLIEFKLQGS
jgi:polyisoprenoid-binding protein YceI